MAVGPLHAVFEAWLQQLVQLAVRFSRLEVLQSALEVALLHGQALELMTAVLEGGHYSLAPRVQPQPPVAMQPSTATLARQPFRSADLSAPRVGAPPSLQPARHAACKQASHCQASHSRTRGVRPQALDREYGLSGLALLSFEELACLVHELARPPLATRMVTCGLAAALLKAAAATFQPGPGSPLINRPAGGPGRLAGAAAAPPASSRAGLTSSPPQVSGPGPLPPTHQAAGSGQGAATGSAAPPVPCPAGASAADSFSPPAQLPRAPLWLLLVSSTLRRCACSLALTVAGLAETRLSATSGAATVERYGLPSPHLLGSVLETRGVGRGFKLAAQEPLADEEGGAPAPSPPSAPALGAGCGPQQVEWGGLTALALVQPILLLKAVKLLRITCKQWPGTGSELLRALAALPELLDPCTQLRPLFTQLQPMAPEACQRARVAGQGSAALALAVLDRKQWHATSSLPDLLPQPQRVTPSPQCEVQGRGTPPPQTAPAAAASWGSPSTPGGGEEQVGAGGVAGPDLVATGPAQAGSCGAGGPSSMSCVWEAHASCLVAASPRDPSWLEPARLVQQRHQVQVRLGGPGAQHRRRAQRAPVSPAPVCLQVALAALQGALQHVRELPPPEVVGATPGLSDSLHLLGCCNARCHNRLPGLPERSVGLRKCATCKRVAYCSEQCRAEAAQDVHDLFCHWWAAMAGE
ncbi:hypothetical protein QJQ45_012349 [Haematococcus lacustris]|nr:hypothetical protein QJQ45_012349 [Haematococcus lacustris]